MNSPKHAKKRTTNLLIVVSVVLLGTLFFPANEREENKKEKTTSESPIFNEETEIEYEKQLIEEMKLASEKEASEAKSSFMDWFLKNETSNKTITILKKNLDDDNILVQLQDSQGTKLVTFMAKSRKKSEETDWKICQEGVTIQEIVDCAFTAYIEVGGNGTKMENLEAQVATLWNRKEMDKFFPDTIREILEQKNQYPVTCPKVVARQLKGKGEMEEKALEESFKATIQVLVDEGLEDVPDNVIYAGLESLGSGVWRNYQGTLYCYM